MKIEIWSDIVCPFCYIGKRRFESAMEQFEHSGKVSIEYKSFQLNPNTVTDTTISAHENLAMHKGITVEQAKQMGDQVTQMAKEVGLHYDFDKAVVANTFNAHRLLHFAKDFGKQIEAKELLLKAYFTEGKNIDDLNELKNIIEILELNSAEFEKNMSDDQFTNEVRSDIQEAGQLRIQGVPFYVFDRKYGVSGAQSADVFLQTLSKSYEEWSQNQNQEALNITKGESCDVDGNC